MFFHTPCRLVRRSVLPGFRWGGIVGLRSGLGSRGRICSRCRGQVFRGRRSGRPGGVAGLWFLCV